MVNKRFMKFDLKDFNIFIAGGLGEIGISIVNEILKSGASIVILYSSDKNLDHINKLKNKSNIKILKTNYSIFEKLCEDISKYSLNEKTNCMISTVGTGKMRSKYPFDQEDIKNIWDINYFFNRNLIIAMSEVISKNNQFNPYNKASHILTSSIASSKNVNAPLEYCSAKSALETLVKNLSINIAPNQRINSISPGHIFTYQGTWGQKSKYAPEEFDDIVKNTIPLKRIGKPLDISSMYLYLISDISSYLTGTNIVIDGGISANQ